MKTVVQVCIPKTKRDAYDYLPGNAKPSIGTRVIVPFQRRSMVGMVLGYTESTLPASRLKSIETELDTEPLYSANELALIRWIARYYQAPLSEVLALVLPKQLRQDKPLQLPQDIHYLLSPDAEISLAKNAHQQQTVIDQLRNASPMGLSASTLRKTASLQSLRSLEQKGWIVAKSILKLPQSHSRAAEVPLKLNEEQQQAVEYICQTLDRYHCFLLQGVTGSGKTEVYLQVIEQVLQQSKQVLIIVPEIGLTPQLITRFERRFSHPMSVLHSQLSDGKRAQAWMLARAGKLKIIIGTRTAVFTPMPNLGLIVIDEEHDTSLKQMEGVRYSARDTALMRAKLSDIPVVLGSATPSLESLHNVQLGKYQCLHLNHKALSQTPLHYRLIDLRNAKLQDGLAAATLQGIQRHLSEGNQVLVFLNRRGFAPVVLCHQCGAMIDCPDCDSHLTLHRHQQGLHCHHCGRKQPMPSHCAQCQSPELVAVGTGTQRLEQSLEHHFPQYPLLRIDRDKVSKKGALDRMLNAIATGETQLIVGTQMLAKGHHFPNLSLAVILDTDAALTQVDFRALERLGQLLLQVSGRAGRADKAGEVLIQTHQPQHPLLLQLIQKGYDPFAKALLESRKITGMPPWQHMAMIRARDKNYLRAQTFMQTIKTFLQSSELQILGPAPAPLARKAGEHQVQLLIKSHNRKELQHYLTQVREWITMKPTPIPTHWSVDVDPQELA